jgi:hypothetical protein
VTNDCAASALISDLQARTLHERAESDLWKHAKHSFKHDRALDSILVREIVFAITPGIGFPNFAND